MSKVLTARDFEAKYRELSAAVGAENKGSRECIACRGCTDCTFCRDSERLVRCHYCVRCVSCTDCSHCKGSRLLVGCQHCTQAESCLACAYVIRSVALTRCTYCFGCVGLYGKDFHILNEPYTRTEYFEVTRRLMVELGVSTP